MIAGQKLIDQAIERTRIEVNNPEYIYKAALGRLKDERGCAVGYDVLAKEARVRLDALRMVKEGVHPAKVYQWIVNQ